MFFFMSVYKRTIYPHQAHNLLLSCLSAKIRNEGHIYGMPERMTID